MLPHMVIQLLLSYEALQANTTTSFSLIMAAIMVSQPLHEHKHYPTYLTNKHVEAMNDTDCRGEHAHYI